MKILKYTKLSLIATLSIASTGVVLNKQEDVVVEAAVKKTGTWADDYRNVRVVGSTTVGDGAPFCKNIRYGIKEKVKGVSFKVTLPKPEDIKLDQYGNHCIYIGFNNGGNKSVNAKGIEIGLSHAPYKDTDSNGNKYYSWFYNYDGSTQGRIDNGDGRGVKTKSGLDNTKCNASSKAEGNYYKAGDEVLVQLYLDANKRLNLVLNGSLVWTSEATDNGWSTYTYNSNSTVSNNSNTPGTRIINSVEESTRYDKWTSSVGKMHFSDIKVFTSNGWKSVQEGESTWGIKGTADGYGKLYGGIEWTIPNPTVFPKSSLIKTSSDIDNYLGKKPTIYPYNSLSNYFQSVIS